MTDRTHAECIAEVNEDLAKAERVHAEACAIYAAQPTQKARDIVAACETNLLECRQAAQLMPYMTEPTTTLPQAVARWRAANGFAAQDADA